MEQKVELVPHLPLQVQESVKQIMAWTQNLWYLWSYLACETMKTGLLFDLHRFLSFKTSAILGMEDKENGASINAFPVLLCSIFLFTCKVGRTCFTKSSWFQEFILVQKA